MTKKTYYPTVEGNPDFAKLEETILAYWQEHNTFQASIDNRPQNQKDGGNNEFIFYDGPPFANGLPHYGHLLTGYVKDIVARYQTQKGKRVERRFGWDCHGLPAEMGAEKELGISGRMQIMEYGIDKFNAQCQLSVMKYTQEWQDYVNRQGRWVDFENDYKTMDITFMESVLWAFKKLHEKGLVYESMRVMPYSWACETPLSNFETRLDNSYRERADKAVTVAFELNEKPKGAPEADVYKVLAWTTTPWTLPSNLALGVGNEIDYAFAVKEGVCYVGTINSFEKIFAGFRCFERKESSRQDGQAYLIGSELKLNKLKSESSDKKQEPDTQEKVITLLGNEESYYKVSYPKEGDYELHNIFVKGSSLVGLTYQPLFPYFKDHPNAFRIFADEFIQEGDGTGIVHLAPGFGEDDQRVCEANGIKLVCPVDNAGRFTSEIYDLRHDGNHSPLEGESAERSSAGGGQAGRGENTPHRSSKATPTPPQGGSDSFMKEGDPASERLSLQGRNVLDTNDDIIKYLKSQGSWIKTEQVLHNYPHCWRTDTPLIYKAVPSWYVEVTKFKDRMVELNQQINWVPGHIKDGLFGKWLENARDWSISRNRFWGTPIPVWRSDNPQNKELYVFGSIKELEDFFGKKVTDLHRPFIDELTKPDPLDPQYTIRRVEDVFDCWFESGSMPYGQVHYPFENKDWFETHFPADFIVEYTAQTRGWFYTLMVLSTALFDRPPFLNCICHGVVLDEKGQKLSKRLNNYADPRALFAKYGSDALRWLMVSSPVLRGGELLIDKEGNMVRDALRLAIKPIWNAYNFFTLYANADGVKAQFRTDSSDLMDRYILAKAREAVHGINQAMDNYDTPLATSAIEAFFEVLNNWYIRRNRDRFWRSTEFHSPLEGESERQSRSGGGRRGYADTTLAYAKELRQNPTDAEKTLWYKLNREQLGYKFRRQQPIGKYIADFFCSEKRLIIEVDGGQHAEDGKDTERTAFLGKEGYRVLRFWNNEVLENSEGVVAIIIEALNAPHRSSVAAPTPPQGGSGFRADANKQAAYDTLYTVLHVMCRAAAPLLPFVTEAIWSGLVNGAGSIHLTDFPHSSDLPDAGGLTGDMDRVRDVCNAALAIRNAQNLRVRQPLAKLSILGNDVVKLEAYADVIKDEVNVKHIEISEDIGNTASFKLQVNFPIVGKRLPARMKDIIAAAKQGKWNDTGEASIEVGGEVLFPGEYSILLEAKNPRATNPLSTNDALVVLDLSVTEELKAEGIARDVIRLVQQSRKEADLHVSDRIVLNVETPSSEIAQAVDDFKQYIAEQTLAVSVAAGSAGKHRFEQELEGEKVVIGFDVAA